MRILKSVLVATLSLSFVGCATDNRDDFCGRNRLICAGIVVVVAFAVAVVVTAKTKGLPIYSPPAPSDKRLKRDIHRVGVLPNGLPLYSFHYWNDDRIFVGIMAQDLLEDARFRHAVRRSAGGYYLVDLAALGLRIDGDVAQFQEASQRALQAAEQISN